METLTELMATMLEKHQKNLRAHCANEPLPYPELVPDKSDTDEDEE